MRAIHACAAENGVREVGHHLQIVFRLRLRHSVACVWHRVVGDFKWRVAFIVAHAHHAKAAHEQKHLRHCVERLEGINEQSHVAVIDTLEVEIVGSLGGTEVVHHIIPLAAIVGDCLRQRGFQRQLVGEVEFNEMNTLILQKLTVGGSAHGSPSFVAALQRLSHDKASDKATSPCHEYSLSHISLSLFFQQSFLAQCLRGIGNRHTCMVFAQTPSMGGTACRAARRWLPIASSP